MTPATIPQDGTRGFGIKIPFAEYIGLYVVKQTAEGSELRVETRPELINSWGVMTGGVIMSMLDFAMAAAVRGRLGPAISVATIDFNMSFMKAAKGEFYVEGRVLQPGNTYFCEAEARGADGGLLAKGMGTFKPVPPK
jgi:uncharacterized protein (TIGR00369 family)